MPRADHVTFSKMIDSWCIIQARAVQQAVGEGKRGHSSYISQQDGRNPAT